MREYDDYDEYIRDIKRLTDEFTLSDAAQSAVDTIPLETQLSYKVMAGNILDNYANGPDELKQYTEKALYDLILSAQGYSMALADSTYSSIFVLSGTVELLHTLITKHTLVLKAKEGGDGPLEDEFFDAAIDAIVKLVPAMEQTIAKLAMAEEMDEDMYQSFQYLCAVVRESIPACFAYLQGRGKLKSALEGFDDELVAHLVESYLLD